MLSGWRYRKVINVNTSSVYNHGLDYYVVKFKLYYGSGTDNLSTLEIYLNNHARADFGDVRFASDPDTPYMTLLSYWFEEKVDGNYAIVWVKIPVNQNYTWLGLYYGNPNAQYIGDVYQVFIYADTQNDVNANKWYRVDSRATVLWYDSTTIEGQLPDDVWAESIGFPIDIIGGVEVKFRYWNRLYSSDSGDYFNIYGIATDGGEYVIISARHGTYGDDFTVSVEGSDVVRWGFTQDNGVHNVLVRIYVNKVYIGANISTGTGTGTWNTSRTYTKITKIHFGSWNWYGTSSVDIDYVRIRPYVDPEPTLSSVSEEQYLVYSFNDSSDLSLSDSYSISVAVKYDFADSSSLSLSDTYSLTVKLKYDFTDTSNLSLSDSYTIKLRLSFADTSNLSLADAYSISASLKYDFLDSSALNLVEVIGVSQGLTFMDSSNLTLSDAYSISAYTSYSFTDTSNLSLSDGVLVSTGLIFTDVSNLTLSDKYSVSTTPPKTYLDLSWLWWLMVLLLVLITVKALFEALSRK